MMTMISYDLSSRDFHDLPHDFRVELSEGGISEDAWNSLSLEFCQLFVKSLDYDSDEKHQLLNDDLRRRANVSEAMDRLKFVNELNAHRQAEQGELPDEA